MSDADYNYSDDDEDDDIDDDQSDDYLPPSGVGHPSRAPATSASPTVASDLSTVATAGAAAVAAPADEVDLYEALNNKEQMARDDGRWCDICERAFHRHSELRKHLLAKHQIVRLPPTPTNARRHVCPICGSNFKQRGHLKGHIAKHTHKPKRGPMDTGDPSVTRHRCTHPGCSYNSTRIAELTRHLKSHQTEKNLKCTWPGCDYRTNHRGTLNRHLSGHKRPSFTCDFPGCDFATKHSAAALNKHKRSHMAPLRVSRPRAARQPKNPSRPAKPKRQENAYGVWIHDPHRFYGIGIPHPSTLKERVDLFTDPDEEYLDNADVPEAEFSDFSSSDDESDDANGIDGECDEMSDGEPHEQFANEGKTLPEQSSSSTRRENIRDFSRRMSVTFDLGTAGASGDGVPSSSPSRYAAIPPRVVLPGSPVVSHRAGSSVDYATPPSTPSNHSYGTRAQRRRQSMQEEKGFMPLSQFIPMRGIGVGKWLQSHSIAELKRRREDTADGDDVIWDTMSQKKRRTSDSSEDSSEMTMVISTS